MEFAARISEILAHRKRTDGREHVRHLDSAAVSEKVIAVYEQVLRNREARFVDRPRTTFSSRESKPKKKARKPNYVWHLRFLRLQNA
jgi:hypothetical protein